MRHLKRWLAVCLTALLIVPGTPVSEARLLLVNAAEIEESVAETTDEETVETVEEEPDGNIESVQKADTASTDSEESLGTAEEEGDNDGDPGDNVSLEGENAGEGIKSDTIETESTDGGSDSAGEGELVEESLQSEMMEEMETMNTQETGEGAGADQPAASEGDIIANGADGNITWTIDAGGKLTIEGTGDYTGYLDTNPNLWGGYLESITSAEVRVTGMTKAASLFEGCSNLTSLDLSGFDSSNIKDMSNMFRQCRSLTSLDLSSLDTGNVTNMGFMFLGCSNLTSLDLSGFDTSNVRSMLSMFLGCSNLTSLDLSGFDTSNTTDMSYMFSDCSGLTGLDVSSFDTSNVEHMSWMFNGCSNLTSLDVSGFNTGNVKDIGLMFAGCDSLVSLDLSSFDIGGANGIGYMISGCNNLTTIHTPYNISESILLPSVENTVWRLLDGTETTELPQGLDYSVEIKRYNISNNEKEDGSGSDGSGNDNSGSNSSNNNTSDSSAATAAEASSVSYTVAGGDTLWKIAVQFYGDGNQWRRIYENNKDVLRNPDKIYAGQVLEIALTEDGNENIEDEVFYDDFTEAGTYTVQSGDSLWKIATKVYGSGRRWREIFEANMDEISDASQIHAGQVLIIPE